MDHDEEDAQPRREEEGEGDDEERLDRDREDAQPRREEEGEGDDEERLDRDREHRRQDEQPEQPEGKEREHQHRSQDENNEDPIDNLAKELNCTREKALYEYQKRQLEAAGIDIETGLPLARARIVTFDDLSALKPKQTQQQKQPLQQLLQKKEASVISDHLTITSSTSSLSLVQNSGGNGNGSGNSSAATAVPVQPDYYGNLGVFGITFFTKD